MVLTFSALSAWYFFLEPVHSFGLKQGETIPHLIAFICVGGFIWALVGALREAVHKLEVARTGQETLFKELQHRVANNLQLVVTLLRTAHRDLQNPIRAAESLKEAEARIMAMSRLHRHLNSGVAFEKGLEPLLRELVENVFAGLPVSVWLEVEGAPNLSIDQMTAVALLVNEAAMNALKHVFSQGLGTLFTVSLSKFDRDGKLQLVIKDDGPGIGEKLKGTSPSSLGLAIMEAFAAQLGGTLEIVPATGTCLAVRFEARLAPPPHRFGIVGIRDRMRDTRSDRGAEGHKQRRIG